MMMRYHFHLLACQGSPTPTCRSWAVAHLAPSSKHNVGLLMNGVPSRSLDLHSKTERTMCKFGKGPMAYHGISCGHEADERIFPA